MSDLPKRLYRGTADRAHADTELALSRVRDTVEALDAEAIAYTPATPADWSGAPTTVQEALDRIAAVLEDNFGAIP